MKKRRSEFILSLLSKTLILEIMTMLLTLDNWMHKKTMKTKQRLTLMIACKDMLMRKFSKKVTGGLFDNYGIVPKEN